MHPSSATAANPQKSASREASQPSAQRQPHLPATDDANAGMAPPSAATRQRFVHHGYRKAKQEQREWGKRNVGECLWLSARINHSLLHASCFGDDGMSTGLVSLVQLPAKLRMRSKQLQQQSRRPHMQRHRSMMPMRAWLPPDGQQSSHGRRPHRQRNQLLSSRPISTGRRVSKATISPHSTQVSQHSLSSVCLRALAMCCSHPGCGAIDGTCSGCGTAPGLSS